MPDQTSIDAHRARKSQYMAAKMGIIVLCCECRRPIKIHRQFEKLSGLQTVWVHDDERIPCFNDASDGTAYPMNEWDLQDLHDEIMEDDYWYYEGREPTNEELWL